MQRLLKAGFFGDTSVGETEKLSASELLDAVQRLQRKTGISQLGELFQSNEGQEFRKACSFLNSGNSTRTRARWSRRRPAAKSSVWDEEEGGWDAAEEPAPKRAKSKGKGSSLAPKKKVLVKEDWPLDELIKFKAMAAEKITAANFVAMGAAKQQEIIEAMPQPIRTLLDLDGDLSDKEVLVANAQANAPRSRPSCTRPRQHG